MGSIENLAYFFGSCPIILSREVPYAIHFNPIEETDKALVQTGLRWAGKQRFNGFGINGRITEDAVRVPAHKCPYGMKRSKILFLLEANKSNPKFLEDHFEKSGELVSRWASTKKMPKQVKSIFSDPAEDIQKLYKMLGCRLYKIKWNKGFGTDLRKRLDEAVEDYRSVAKKVREYYNVTLDEIQMILNKLVNGRLIEIPVEKFSDNYYPEYVRALEIVAETAYNIRKKNYRTENCFAVRGFKLIHKRSQKILEEIAMQKADKGPSDLDTKSIYMRRLTEAEYVRQILDNLFEYGCKWPRIGVLYDLKLQKENNLHKMNFPNPFDIIGRHAVQMGRLRAEEYFQGQLPYKAEQRLIIQILRHNMNKTAFRNAVNKWLKKQANAQVLWPEIDKELN